MLASKAIAASHDTSPVKRATSKAIPATTEEGFKSEKIKVAVRIRPQLRSEVGKECVCHAQNNKQIRVQDMTHIIDATYDAVFPRNSLQPEVFKFVGECIPSLLQGFNCTIFAYGQTGSGKTYTMFGTGLDQVMRSMAVANNPNLQAGVTPQGSIMSVNHKDKLPSFTNASSNSTTDNTSLFSQHTSVTPALLAAQ